MVPEHCLISGGGRREVPLLRRLPELPNPRRTRMTSQMATAPRRGVSRVRGSFVGEFVTIALGFLVALAADSALEQSRLRGEARLALEALRDDIASDVVQLTEYWEPELARQEGARSRLASFWRSQLPSKTPSSSQGRFEREADLRPRGNPCRM